MQILQPRKLGTPPGNLQASKTSGLSASPGKLQLWGTRLAVAAPCSVPSGREAGQKQSLEAYVWGRCADITEKRSLVELSSW